MSKVIWQHVVKVSNLLGGAAPPSGTAQPPLPLSDVHFYSVLNEKQQKSVFLSCQTDARAAQNLHERSLDVSRRIDLVGDETLPRDPGQAADDFSAVVVINSCPEPNDRNAASAKAPWDATVVTMDRLRQYDVLLYPGGLTRFAGIYPGVVIGVEGAVIRRDPGTMRAAEVAISRLVHAEFPRPALLSSAQTGNSLRVMFAAGPYGRQGPRIERTLMKLVEVAHTRGVQVLVLCGPFMPLPPRGLSQDDKESWMSGLPPTSEMHNILCRVDGAAVAPRKCHVAFIPSPDDLPCVPVVPTIPPLTFPTSNDALSHFDCTNPTEFTAGGLCFGVCSFDVMSMLQASQIDRGLPPDTRTRQLCHSIVRSGSYVPRVEGHCAVDVNLMRHVQFGVGSGLLPHFVFSPNRTFSTPIALSAGGGGGTVVLSCGNVSEDVIDTIVALEVTVADTAVATQRGCTPDNGVSVGVVQLVPAEQ